MFSDEDICLGGEIRLADHDERRSVYRMEDSTGSGALTCYHILPGVALMYSDCYMERYHSEVRVKRKALCIDHCREGRLEWELGNGVFAYQDAGQVRLHTHEGSAGDFCSPLRRLPWHNGRIVR
ncbi:MAG: hypothetical protein LBS11_06685 [Oscillospiraceae bacterium]|nr:hypothetical protein [Oscillospiraceae bacterium]